MLSPTQEAQVLELINQQAALLSLASNEATITSKLAATKVNLSQLSPAATLADSDLLLVRQGIVDKSATGAVLKTLVQTGAVLTTGDQTVAGVKTFTSPPVIPNATASTHPVALGQFTQSLAANGWQRLPSGLIIQWGQVTTPANNVPEAVTLPIAWPTSFLIGLAGTSGPSTAVGVFGVTANGTSPLSVINVTQGGPSAQGTFWFAIGR